MKTEHWIMIGLLLSSIIFIARAIFLFFKENKKVERYCFSVIDTSLYRIGDKLKINSSIVKIIKIDFKNNLVYVKK
jgi:hypothetical protein